MDLEGSVKYKVKADRKDETDSLFNTDSSYGIIILRLFNEISISKDNENGNI